MSEMDKKRREAIRYLGFGRNAADERTYELIEASFDDLNRETSPRFVYRIFDLDHSVDGLLRVGTMEIQSKSLLRNLKGCGQVVLFGATLGAGVDRLIRRVSLTDMARAVVLQACAAAELEEYCDEQQKKISTELEKSGLYLRPWIWGLPDRVPGADHEDAGLCKEDWSYDDRQLYDESDEVCDCNHRDQHRERKMPDLRL